MIKNEQYYGLTPAFNTAKSKPGWPRNLSSLTKEQAELLLRETYNKMKWLDGTPMDDVAEVVIRWLNNPY